jgi:hypothetical protein
MANEPVRETWAKEAPEAAKTARATSVFFMRINLQWLTRDLRKFPQPNFQMQKLDGLEHTERALAKFPLIESATSPSFVVHLQRNVHCNYRVINVPFHGTSCIPTSSNGFSESLQLPQTFFVLQKLKKPHCVSTMGL